MRYYNNIFQNRMNKLITFIDTKQLVGQLSLLEEHSAIEVNIKDISYILNKLNSSNSYKWINSGIIEKDLEKWVTSDLLVNTVIESNKVVIGGHIWVKKRINIRSKAS